MNLVQVENVSETPDMENSVPDVENLGEDLEAETFVPNFEPYGLRSNSSQVENISLSPGTENSLPDVENLGEDSEEDGFVSKKDPYHMRSSSSQCRDRQTISEAANNDRVAVLSTGAKMFSQEGNKAASTIVKRLNADPSLGEPWLKCLKKMEDDLEKTRVTPIACLAYLLGILPCSRSQLDLKPNGLVYKTEFANLIGSCRPALGIKQSAIFIHLHIPLWPKKLNIV